MQSDFFPVGQNITKPPARPAWRLYVADGLCILTPNQLGRGRFCSAGSVQNISVPLRWHEKQQPDAWGTELPFLEGLLLSLWHWSFGRIYKHAQTEHVPPKYKQIYIKVYCSARWASFKDENLCQLHGTSWPYLCLYSSCPALIGTK